MKKNFLLLLLMTLLPLAGWAAIIDVEVRPFDASVDWTGAKPARVQPSWITCTPAVDETVKTAIANALTIQDLDSYNVGIKTYKLQKLANSVESGGNTYNLMVSSSYSAELTIEKFTGAPDFNTDALAFVGGDLVYTSEAQALLAGGATATANGTEVPVVYTTKATPAENDWVALENLKEINANTYTVYYKVVGTDNYAGSAVQTLAGSKAIAQLNQNFNADGAKPIANTWIYDAQAHVLFTAPTAPVAFGTYEYSLTGADETWYTSEAIAASEELTAAFKGTSNTGNKTVYWRVLATDNYTGFDATALIATITKATPVITNPTFNTGLVYDGTAQALISEAATATLGATVSYRTQRSKNVNDTWTGWGDWVTDAAAVTGTAAAQYQVQVKTTATADLNAVAATLLTTKPRIAKATIPETAYVLPVAKTSLRNTGSPQELVTAASWTGDSYGTLQYSTDGNTWSTNIPKGTDVGNYTVYFRIYPTVVNYTQNYNEVTATLENIEIAEKSTVTIAAKANQTFGYGTTPVIDYTTVWTEQGSDELVVTDMVWNWYTDSGCSTPAMVDGNGNFTVGDYFVKASGATVTGETAASQAIVYTPVAVKITAGQVTAKISGTATYGSLPTFTLTHVSGLSPAEAENFNAANNLTNVTIKQNGEVVNNLENVAPNNAGLAALAKGEYDLEATASCGTDYAVVVTGEKLTVGAKSIAGAVIDVTTDADDIVYNNKAWGTVNPIAFTVTETSGIEAADYDVTYSNNVNAGTATITLTGKRNYTGTVNKTFTIKKAALTIKANNTTWIYGTTEPTYTVTVDGQAEGETALQVGGTLAGINDALTVVRTSNETVGTHAGALVAQFGSTQPLESANYTITYSAGNLQIAQAALTIKLKNDVITGIYGDAPSVAITAAILTDKANYELDNCELPDGNLADILNVDGVIFSMVNPIENNKYEVNDAGYEFAMTGATTTNYAVEISNGTYKVSPSAIKLYAKNQSINWAEDPSATPNTTVSDATVGIDTENSGRGLQCGDDLTDLVASIDIVSTNVGENDINLTLKTNANYTVTWTPGTLTVTPAAALTLRTADADLAAKLASYNGQTMPVSIDFSARNARELPAGTPRAWTANTWVTLTLPFDISVADLSKAFGYAIVNVIDPSRTEISGTGSKFYGMLTMTGGNGNDTKLAANKPFMVKTADAITGVINFGNQTIVAPATDADLSVNVDDAGTVKFTGTYATKNVTSADKANIWFMLGGGYTKWAYITTTSSASWDILPFEGFIDMSALPATASSNVTFFFQEIDGSVTAINSVSADGIDSTKLNAEGWYNLNGMKLQGAPAQKGVYIKDGKKVVIK